MSNTYTSTFTITHAQYLASKVAADLKQMQLFYGEPKDDHIQELVEELTLFLKNGYLQSIDYGFKSGGTWVIAVSYEVNPVTGLFIDNNPGRIAPGKNINGATFSSHRRPSRKYDLLSPAERETFDNLNPIKWTGAPDPQTGLLGAYDKTYSAGNQQLNRKILG